MRLANRIVRALRRLPAAAAAVALAAAQAAFAAEYERPIDRGFESGNLRAVALENLAGRVEIVGVEGGSVRVTGTVFAEASAGESARELGESLRVEIDESGDRLTVRALYPIDEHRRYHYPQGRRIEGEPSWLFDWLGDWSSSTRYQGRDVRITSEP